MSNCAGECRQYHTAKTVSARLQQSLPGYRKGSDGNGRFVSATIGDLRSPPWRHAVTRVRTSKRGWASRAGRSR